jgi:hypothetical protein
MFSLLAFSFALISDFDIQIDRMHENHDQEIATKGTVELPFKVSEKNLKACLPRESIPFPASLSKDLSEKIFSEGPMEALMKCNRKSCAFNFSFPELVQLEKAKTPEERQKLYFEFYKRRVATREKVSPEYARLFIHGKDKAFEDCDSSEFHKILDERPIAHPTYRLSHIQYNPRMRPTTRILQGEWFHPNSTTTCYVESLIFSDHYDAERVEVWSATTSDGKTKLKLQIRHRVDLLNTWLRRLNKEGVRVELDDLIKAELEDAATCLKKAQT